MKYLSVCSGIEAASVAWHSLGWTPLAFSEIEAFPRAVLEHHYPDTPLHGDFTVLRHEPWIADADVLVGGTPCQAFSVAGLRKSLDDDRGNLSLEFIRLADSIDAAREAQGRDPSIIVWENVPGVLSVKDNAFGCFLAALAGDAAPYVPPRGKWTNAGVVDGPQRQVAWRILDAQYFGLAQRRRRVFVVASAREGFDPAAVLLEFEGLRRDSPPRREAGQVAPTIPSRSTAGGGLGTDFDCDGGVIRAVAMEDPVPPLMARSSRGGAQTLSPGHQTDGHMVAVEQPVIMAHGQANAEIRTDGGAPTLSCIHEAPIVTHSLRAEGFDASEDASEDGTGRGTPLVPVMAFSCKDSGNDVSEDISPTLRSMANRNSTPNGGGQVAVAIPQSGETGKGDAAPCVAVAFSPLQGGRSMPVTEEAPTLEAGTGNKAPAVMQHMAVRRLTPVECSRLQGFPDDYLLSVTWRGKCPPPDGVMYKALGNSMAVPCMRFIGTRIARHLRGEI